MLEEEKALELVSKDSIGRNIGNRATELRVVLRKLGQPPKFDSPKELVKLFKKYFKNTEFSQWTITGLALACGTNRQTLVNYEKKEEYKKVIQQAKTMIENSYEISLRKNGRSGDIFALKQFGWKDEMDFNQNLKGEVKTGINWIPTGQLPQKEEPIQIEGGISDESEEYKD